MVLPEENLHVQVTGQGQVCRGWGVGGSGPAAAWTPPKAPGTRRVCRAPAGQSRRSCRTRGRTARRPRTPGKRGRSSSHFAQTSECHWLDEGGLEARSASHLLHGPGEWGFLSQSLGSNSGWATAVWPGARPLPFLGLFSHFLNGGRGLRWLVLVGFLRMK